MIFSNDDQKNKYHQVWKEIFKIVNNGNGKLEIHEKIALLQKIALNHLSYQIIKK